MDPASPWSVALPVSLIADGAPLLEVVRLAADGAWFDRLLARGERPAYFPRVRDQLLVLADANAAPDKPS
ncbi:hypothetical protein RBA41_20255 [Massilia sp. CCM 9210]|uniref:hypothetical protein n=1 Tax=Massilia scottii TaxID=3057166 RepID=UPI0027969986|nr:hypothetical protein [Massilia sp. CCM 9210]MDQ1815633.1 hypothetical protein [Massilia sp. CCM 9210]